MKKWICLLLTALLCLGIFCGCAKQVEEAPAEPKQDEAADAAPAGEQTAARVEAIILDINRFVSDAIPDADIEVFYKTLTTITQNLQLAVEKYGRETLE